VTTKKKTPLTVIPFLTGPILSVLGITVGFLNKSYKWNNYWQDDIISQWLTNRQRVIIIAAGGLCHLSVNILLWGIYWNDRVSLFLGGLALSVSGKTTAAGKTASDAVRQSDTHFVWSIPRLYTLWSDSYNYYSIRGKLAIPNCRVQIISWIFKMVCHVWLSSPQTRMAS